MDRAGRAPLDALQAAQGLPVAIVGDLILDEYLRGHVERISPEAPVPVLKPASVDFALGGAANVAHNLLTLGAEVHVVGVVGDDEYGRRLVETLGGLGAHVEGVVVDRTRVTTHKQRVVGRGQHILRIDREDARALTGEVQRALSAALRRAGERVRGVVCSDYSKGVITGELMAAAVELRERRGLRVTVDPKGFDYSRYRGVDLITPNLGELRVASGLDVDDAAAIDRAARVVFDRTQCRALLVTCGKDGVRLYEGAGAPPLSIAAEAREVFDVTGAGDTVIATASLLLFAGASLPVASRLANTAAGVVVEKLGTAAVTTGELQERLGGAGRSKVLSSEQAARRVQHYKDAGKTVVFTNGCFDILHAGHVAFLEAARAKGDVLVVGLNSDASVRANKGPTRPLVPGVHRAAVLSALSCVDHVVFFDEERPERIIAELVPNVLVKGSDYRLEQVAGRETVERHGGRVELVELVEGLSTSALVRAIVERHRDGGGA